jgi:hypothetical protein
MENALEKAELTIPKFGNLPEMTFDISKVREGERRLIEAKYVTVSTFLELQYTFNESYRQARQHLTAIGYQITVTKKEINKIKALYIFDEYQDYLKSKKMKDSTDIREAYLSTKEDYSQVTDRLALLEATESLFEGKIKVFENVCQYCRKEMDLNNRSGMNSNKYTT